MQSKLFILSLTILFACTGYVFAESSTDQQNQSIAEKKTIEVGNKTCPVTGNPVNDGKMGELVKYEYKGKIYNLCCKMCLKDFKKDPEKYSKIAEEQAAKGKMMMEEKKTEKQEEHIHHEHEHHVK